MKQLRRTLTLAAGLLLLALPGLAQDRMPVHMSEGRAFPFLRCLRGADLTDAQKADIKAIADAARPLLQAAHEKVRADRQKLHADVEAGADKSIIGEDVLNLHSDMKAARAELATVKDQVASKLTAEQKAKIGDCLASSGPRGLRGRHSD